MSSSDDDEFLDLPKNAVSLRCHPMSNHVYYLPDTNTVLKVGYEVHEHEFETLKLLASQTTVPVPQPIDFYYKKNQGFLYMSKIEGKNLKSVWRTLTQEGKDKIVSQLRDYIRQWRTIPADKFGAVGGRPCQECFFRHWSPPVKSVLSYGPYNSREEYNTGLVEAINNSRGPDTLAPFPQNLAERICSLQEEEKILSHGDLHRANILVNDDAVITGIVDWGSASFSIMDREYFDTRNRARSHSESWQTAVEQLFPDNEKANYELFRELERELIIYCGF